MQSSSLEYGEKKRTPVKKLKRPPPKKLKMSAKGGHDRSFQKRMEIAILPSRGVKHAEIVKTVGCTFDMAIRWTHRSEDANWLSSIKTQGQSRTQTYCCHTFGEEKTLQAAQGIKTEKVGEEIDSES